MPENVKTFDRINALLAGLVFVLSFIVYALTVQPTFSYWDSGEFIASAYILGIPHPTGTPLFILLGRIFSMIPIVEDIAHRINYMSVLFSAVTAMMSYLLTVKLVRYFFEDQGSSNLNRIIIYIGGLTGAFFVAFGATNWSNSVEAEVYAPSLALSVLFVWLTIRYWESQETAVATRTMLLVFYLAMVGIGIHLTEFLVVPIVALFYVLKPEATKKDWLIICGFAITELLLVFIFSNFGGAKPQEMAKAYNAFTIVSGLLALGVVAMLYRKINWGISYAIVTIGTVMMGFGLYLELMAPFTLTYALLPGAHFSWDVFTLKTLIYWLILVGGLILAVRLERKGIHIKWREGLAIIVLGFIGFSVHLYLPIRSELNPRIDENNPSRDWRTFVSMLDRKQYGQISMTERMFNRRGAWSNQFGRHKNMGFWSYFEEQYSPGGWTFLPFLGLGLLGMIVAIKRRLELGVPFMTLFLLVSAGLILYMNFADGTHYNIDTGDAYLEVRNRDYFYTPAFVFFGIAMGMGVAALLHLLKDNWAAGKPQMQKVVTYAGTLLFLLPVVTFAKNYHANDRSKDYLPYNYAANILDSCEENAILFTSGDNDTFPVWCLQEVYDYRKDVRVVNLSLLNTDWYVLQMKEQYGVPISLSKEQIQWHPFEVSKGVVAFRPLKPFKDRPRQRVEYMWPTRIGNRTIRVQDMMVDEIVLENKWQQPIYFSAPPYAESPLNLRSRAVLEGVVYRLKREPNERLIDVDKGFDNFMNVYRFDGYQDSKIYRNANATGVFLGVGMNAMRFAQELLYQGDSTRFLQLMHHLLDSYPEYWQASLELVNFYDRRGDSAIADSIIHLAVDSLKAFSESNPENLFYLEDLGLLKSELGRRNNDQALIDEGVDLMWQAFLGNPNSGYSFRKLITNLTQSGKYLERRQAAEIFTRYGVNRNDPIARQILQSGSSGPGL